MKAFHYQDPHPMQPQSAAVIMCFWQERSPWDYPASGTERLLFSERVLTPVWAQNISRYPKAKGKLHFVVLLRSRATYFTALKNWSCCPRPSIQPAEAPLYCRGSRRVGFSLLNLNLKMFTTFLPRSVVTSLHDQMESHLGGGIFESNDANSKQELDHERWALLLHFSNCKLPSAGARCGGEAESVYGSLSPCLPDWDSLTRAQQAPALPGAACGMLSYSNPSGLHFLCAELRLRSFPFSCSLSALSSRIAGSCAVLWHCPASPLVPESQTPRSERQPAKHPGACSGLGAAWSNSALEG